MRPAKMKLTTATDVLANLRSFAGNRNARCKAGGGGVGGANSNLGDPYSYLLL